MAAGDGSTFVTGRATGAVVSWGAATKWAVRGGGDAVVVSQPSPDYLVGVLIDVQGSSPGGSRLAWSLVPFAIQLAGEGADAELIARGLNRALCVRRGGAVQASLGIIMIAPEVSVSAAVYGNVLIHQRGSAPSAVSMPTPAGLDMDALPILHRLDVANGPVVLCSDGVAESQAGLDDLLVHTDRDDFTAAAIIGRAVARDAGRPRGDMAVILVSESGDAPSSPPSIAGMLSVTSSPVRKGVPA